MLASDIKRQLAEIPDDAEVGYKLCRIESDEMVSLIFHLPGQNMWVINNIEEYQFPPEKPYKRGGNV